jgi:hypothetical protein
MGKDGRLDRRLDVGEVAGCDRMRHDEWRLAVGHDREARIGAADIPDQDRKGQRVGMRRALGHDALYSFT